MAADADYGARPSAADLYRRYAGHVLRWVLRYYDLREGEEIVHEIFAKVVVSLDGFRAQASPTTWLYRLTTNHCLRRLRDEGRRRALWKEHGSTMWAASSPPADQEAVAYLRQFWDGLDDELIEVGIHYFVDGMSHAQIAELVGCSPRTIGYRLQRLRELARDEPKGTSGEV